MTRGTGPPPPLGDHPNGIDISLPPYAIDNVTWHETPKQYSENYMNTASMTLRTTNDSAYKLVGNAITWNSYVLFGYHAYDHCFQFDTQWERMKQNQTDTLKFIWDSYSYAVSRRMLIPTKLERWALDIAHPYLQTHLPSALSVDTTDPRSARRIYDEDEIMEDDDRTDKKLPAADNWTPVQGKTKRHTKEALDTPLPDSPIRPSHLPPVPIAQMANPSTVHPNFTHPTPAATTNGLNFVRINDGTLRVTVRWKPENYNNISDDEEQWNLAATDTIHYILETVSDAILFPWRNGSNTPHIPSLELTPDNLLCYLAPKITKIESIQMYVFSFRLCLSTGAGKWIGDKQTKRNLERQNVEINISNSSSDSGDTIPIAGYIFFKHPKFTQRKYYLSHLRRHLPATTPFFDIGYHRKTPTGQDIPHLTIKCGENHVGPLTEILSSYLDGTNTAVFLGRLLLSKMSTIEVDALFQTHADYMANTRIITMAPTIQNIDLIRTEHSGNENMERNTREWATSLKDTDGNSLRCDADNGGDSRRAQLIVPVEHMAKVHHLFAEYKESISTFNQREADFTSLIQEASPPQAIYVPTAAVHNNLALIQKQSTSTVWENAPASVRRPDGTLPNRGYKPPTSSTNKPPTAKPPLFPQAHLQPQPTNAKPAMANTTAKKLHQNAMDPIQEVDMTDETATTHSQMTKSMTTQNKFAEIEANIRRHQQAVTQHQADLAQVNERALITLTLVEKTAADVQQLTEHTTEQLTALRTELRQEAALQAQAQQEGFARMMILIQQLTNTSAPSTDTAPIQPDDSIPDVTYNSDADSDHQGYEDTMSTQTTETDTLSSLAVTSPVKKKNKRKSREPANTDMIRKNLNPPSPPSDQDTSAQYNNPRTPDDGET